MRRTLCIIICFTVIFILTSCNQREWESTLIPTEISWEEAREIAENKQAELRDFFNNHRALLQELQTQLLPLRDEIDLFSIFLLDSQISASGRNVEKIDLEILDPQLMQQLEQYFDAVGRQQHSPRISVRTISQYLTISFSFRLPNQVEIGIRYTPDFQLERWEHLDGNWFIFVDRLLIE